MAAAPNTINFVQNGKQIFLHNTKPSDDFITSKGENFCRILASPFTANPELRKKHYHLIDNQKHFLVTVAKVGGGSIHLDLTCGSWKDFHGLPEWEKDFIKTLENTQQFEQLNLDTPQEENQEAANYIDVAQSCFLFSDELIDGMKGKRGADHVIEKDLLEQCVQKLQKKPYVKTLAKGQQLDLYFNIQEEDGSFKILNLVLARIDSYQFIIKNSLLPNT